MGKAHNTSTNSLKWPLALKDDSFKMRLDNSNRQAAAAEDAKLLFNHFRTKKKLINQSQLVVVSRKAKKIKWKVAETISINASC